MTRISIFTPVVAAAFFAVSSPVAAADPLRITSYNVCYTKLLRLPMRAAPVHPVTPVATPEGVEHGPRPWRNSVGHRILLRRLKRKIAFEATSRP